MDDEQQRCQVCGRLFEAGGLQVCRGCQRDKGQPRLWRWKKHPHLRCDCGKRAVTVVTVKVGMDGSYRMRMPLCADCLRLEEESRR